jgi:hypothetical protein
MYTLGINDPSQLLNDGHEVFSVLVGIALRRGFTEDVKVFLLVLADGDETLNTFSKAVFACLFPPHLVEGVVLIALGDGENSLAKVYRSALQEGTNVVLLVVVGEEGGVTAGPTSKGDGVDVFALSCIHMSEEEGFVLRTPHVKKLCPNLTTVLYLTLTRIGLRDKTRGNEATSDEGRGVVSIDNIAIFEDAVNVFVKMQMCPRGTVDKPVDETTKKLVTDMRLHDMTEHILDANGIDRSFGFEAVGKVVVAKPTMTNPSSNLSVATILEDESAIRVVIRTAFVTRSFAITSELFTMRENIIQRHAMPPFVLRG